jgi:hypothetical protein
MITFELNESKTGIEVFIDSIGVDELIHYLNFIKDADESMHLIGGNELDETVNHKGNILVNHVKLIYLNE